MTITTSPRRIQMSRQRPWRAEHPDAVIVARPSKWGNPYRVSPVMDRAECVTRYRARIEAFAQSDRECWMSDGLSIYDRHIIEHIREALAGKDLACWCSLSEPCHADVLLEIANGADR